MAEILGTELMDNKTSSLSQCCFANVKLPLVFKKRDENSYFNEEALDPEDIGLVQKWLNAKAAKEFDTYLQIAFHYGNMWVRLSAQTYLELRDFEWVGVRLKELCARAQKGHFKHS